MNAVQLVGFIGKEPEMHTFENGNKKSSFSMATEESYKDKAGEWQKSTQWHNIVLYRETKLRKGDLISVEGKISTRSWEDKEGGTRYTTEIIASKAGLLNRKKEAPPAQNTTAQNQSTQTPTAKQGNDIPPGEDDDLPF